eukprot:TRINITY_DN19320_c0_g1_i1.p1 TRINITY_DN19320_c0_g1~~TRINITY_DN19320_c0_g1_i1.p1  ORF type:complete len:480 (+),score=159.85 TRINITY_DN19320_c0_g1_i1:69-1508(+)
MLRAGAAAVRCALCRGVHPAAPGLPARRGAAAAAAVAEAAPAAHPEGPPGAGACGEPFPPEPATQEGAESDGEGAVTVTDSALVAREAAELVFRDAVSSRLVLQTDLSTKQRQAPSAVFQPRVRNHTVETTVDNMWQMWDGLDRYKDDWEQLDLPRAASRLTVELRWKVIQLRHRDDRYLQISDVMARRHRNRLDTYRRAYRSVLQRLKAEGRGALTAPCHPQHAAELLTVTYWDFVMARANRDWMTVLYDDSYRRAAKQYNWVRMRDIGKYYWKHDWYYRTKWERRGNMLKTFLKIQWYMFKLPLVFGMWRSLLVTAEHLSLFADITAARYRARRAGLEPTVRASKLAEAKLERQEAREQQAKLADEGEAFGTLQTQQEAAIDRFTVTERGQGFRHIWVIVLLGVFLYTVKWFFYEGKIPRWLLPEHERVARLAEDEWESSPKKVAGKPPPEPVPPELQPAHKPQAPFGFWFKRRPAD